MGVTYFFITPSMKDTLWGGREVGLILLLRNSADFTNIYTSPKFEVWKYTPPAPGAQ